MKYKAFVEVQPPTLSIAMHRVAKALKQYAPSRLVEFVDSPEEADIQVVHVIGPDQAALIKSPNHAVMQYCAGDDASTTGPGVWGPLWDKATCVWSYYDLSRQLGDKLYCRPLGVDKPFTDSFEEVERDILCVTSGYVDGYGAEAIKAVAEAARIVGGKVVHVGPVPVGMESMPSDSWTSEYGISDWRLAHLLRRAQYVSGLRWIEGFEMMTVEGLACGAKPILFHRPDSHRWQRDQVYVRENPDTVVEDLVAIFKDTYFPPDRTLIKRYDWQELVEGFWKKALKPIVRTAPRQHRKRRLLWIGDAVAKTGFAKCTHETLNVLRETWDVSVLGLNYLGDPHEYPYKVYPCIPGGDFFGLGRTKELCEKIKPDVVVIQNDVWCVGQYIPYIPNGIKIVGAMPVDAPNAGMADTLNELSLGIFWTEFGKNEAVTAGFKPPTEVIGLGVDRNIFQPMDMNEARKVVGLDAVPKGAFIVGNVNRNQPRKRMDLMVRYFTKWVNEYNIDDAFLFLHVAPTGDNGYDVRRLMRYYLPGKKRLILAEPDVLDAPTDHIVRATMCSMNLMASTTQGEGWGLTTLEGMACRVPQMGPKWAALAEWPAYGIHLVPCTSTHATVGQTGAPIGGIADEERFVLSLNFYYRNRARLAELAEQGYTRAQDPQFSWRVIGERWTQVLDEHLHIPQEVVV